MPTYLYETLPASPDEVIERFEVKQSFAEPALTAHPETGAPVRRVISGGIGLMTKSESSLPQAGPGCGPANCGCGRFS
jgi:predicted nucleic acid-binding Zn ribbon protein